MTTIHEGSHLLDVQDAIGAWSRATFPNQTAASIGRHLVEEVGELNSAIASLPSADVVDEIADCLILLFALADYLDLDSLDAVRDKHERNVASQYAYDASAGYDKRVVE